MVCTLCTLCILLIVEDTYDIQKLTPAQPNFIPLSDCNFNEDAITKALDNIKANKLPGPDCIASTVLKEAKYQIIKPFTILFNKSFNTGRVHNI